ncbi:MAG: mechanosensitive ion channel family protein [Labilithrix sp.]
MRWLRVIFVFLTLSFCVLDARAARAAEPAKAPSTGPTTTAADEEVSDSPRVSMRSFFELSERGRWEEAAVYLDLPRGTEKRGPELASKLYAVISQRLLIHPEQLSPLAKGRETDGLPAGTEELGKITDSKGHPVAIRIVRHEARAPDDEPRWVFAQSTVSHVDMLYAALRDRWVREHLPPSLLLVGPLSLYYWQWLALPLLAIAAIAIGRVLMHGSAIVAKKLLPAYPWSERLLRGLKGPVTLGFGLALLALVIPWLALSLAAEEIVQRLLRALAYLTFFWALLRGVAVLGDELLIADWARTRPTARSLSAVAVSLGKVIVAAFALMVALSELGYPVTSVIAGLGIGGVALALAAQKTVENLFGSLSILADQPFRVGDTVKVDTIEGAVETIGLRSTRIRTADRTLVVFPNGKLADMRIESLGPRERIRFATKLPLSRGTSTEQVKAVVEAVRLALVGHAKVRTEDVFVRFSAIGEASFDVDASAPIDTLDAAEFGKIREELLLLCLDAVAQSGAKLVDLRRAGVQ